MVGPDDLGVKFSGDNPKQGDNSGNYIGDFKITGRIMLIV